MNKHSTAKTNYKPVSSLKTFFDESQPNQTLNCLTLVFLVNQQFYKSRDVLRTLSKSYDGTFFRHQLTTNTFLNTDTCALSTMIFLNNNLYDLRFKYPRSSSPVDLKLAAGIFASNAKSKLDFQLKICIFSPSLQTFLLQENFIVLAAQLL